MKHYQYLWMNLLNSDIAVTVSAIIPAAFEIWSNTDGLFELHNMRKIFGTYRFNLLYDRLAGGFRNPDLGARVLLLYPLSSLLSLQFLAIISISRSGCLA